MSDYLKVLFVLVGLSAVALALFSLKRKVFGFHGFKAKQLLTPNEVDFYKRLVRAAGPQWTVFPQVSMGALVDTTLTANHPDFWQEKRRFGMKIVDFVICDSKTLSPCLLVELDDRMHDFSKDRQRDRITAAAGLRTLRFWSRKKPDDATLKNELQKALCLNRHVACEVAPVLV